ncbi:MAG: hypothetical protein U5N10_08910 [Gemmobacter sp.]|nr:hypothetical protein [Gemmobacter sp.]
MTDMTDIERGLDNSRKALADTLNQLRGRMAPDTLARDSIDLLQTRGAALAGAAGKAVRANPVGFAVAGAGLALIAYGIYRQNGTRTEQAAERVTVAKAEPVARWEDEGGATAIAPQQPTLPTATAAPRAAAEDDDADSWILRLRDVQQGARDRLHEIEAAASREAAALRDGITDRGAAMRDFTAEKTALASDYLKDSREALAEGLHDLSQSARARVLAAREKAWDAAERAEAAARDGLRRGGQAASDHPLLAAALGLGIGAAVAALLPRTQTEDDAFGRESDRLMADAARLLREERDRLSQVAEAAGAELGVAARSALNRVAERTQEEMRQRHSSHRPNGATH